MKRIYFIISAMILLSLQNVKPAFSVDEPFYATQKVRPNVLILLDRSGSMEDQPNCASYCNGDGAWCAQANTDTDNDGTNNLWDSTPGCATENKISIAVRVLADLLDADDSRVVDNANDPTSLDVRLGYGQFINGNIAIPYNNSTRVGQPYPSIFQAFNSSNNGGNTPLGNSLNTALNYFQTASEIINDGCITCRKNYVILITDGADTATCNTQTARNRSVVYAANALYDAGIPVFVVGFGNLPNDLRYTLNWAAYYGYGGNDPNLDANSGGNNVDTGSFTPCASLCDSGAADPGTQTKLGYAFLASDAHALTTSLQRIIGIINAASFTRSAPVLAITTGTSTNGNRIYQGFFELGGSVNWQGHLLAWDLDANGDLILNTPPNPPCTSSISDTFGELGELYDAGRTLTYSSCYNGAEYVAPASRRIYTVVNTLLNSSATKFDAWGAANNNNTNAEQIALCNALNITGFNCSNDYSSNTVGSSNELINFIRFGSSTFNGSGGARNNNWHLGDIWHSTPTIVGPPLGTINNTAYKTFKSNNSSRRRVLIAGANDGMLHAFDDGAPSNYSGRGKELWSFIPNNLLGKLQNLSASHSFFLDASPTAVDVCINANNNNCDTVSTQTANDWKTVVIAGERDGGRAYFALDITDTTIPSYMWQFTDANLGNTWSKPAVGKVRYNNGASSVDRYLTFFGGGVYPDDPNNSNDEIGNYVYAVNIADGKLLNDGTADATKKQVDSGNLSNDVPSALSPVDLNNDAYIDAVYFGDSLGRMHRWNVSNLANNNPGTLTRFFEPGATHYYVDNTGNRVVEGGTHANRPIYYRPAVALDDRFRPLVVFGTGMIDELSASPPSDTTIDYVYAIRQEIGYTGNEAGQSGVTEMWKIILNCQNSNPNTGCGERLTSPPIIFGGYVLFVTYRPATTNSCTENGNTVSCNPGSAWLYIVELGTGINYQDNNTIYPTEIGRGIGNITCKGDTCYTTTSNDIEIKKYKIPDKYPNAEVIYWRER